MKKLLIVGLLLINCISICLSQEFCNNFKIVSILDFPPSPLTPGGNYFLLLLTVKQDNPRNLSLYSNLFFVDQLGDTISIPTGPSSHLPIYTTDTIPYILKLNSPNSNQDFPEDFNGNLVINKPGNPTCEVSYSNQSSSINHLTEKGQVSIYPNPFLDEIKIKSALRIEKVLIIDCLGRVLDSYFPNSISSGMNLEKLRSGSYFMAIQFDNGETIIHAIVKT